MMDQQHWWKLLVSDKSGLMNTDDKASVLIQTATIIAVTGIATLPWTVLTSVLLNAVTKRAFFRVYHSTRSAAIFYTLWKQIQRSLSVTSPTMRVRALFSPSSRGENPCSLCIIEKLCILLKWWEYCNLLPTFCNILASVVFRLKSSNFQVSTSLLFSLRKTSLSSSKTDALKLPLRVKRLENLDLLKVRTFRQRKKKRRNTRNGEKQIEI